MLVKFFDFPDMCLQYSIDEYPKNSSFHLHVHDTYEILCIVSGKVGYIVEGHVYDLRPGGVMIMRSAEMHKILVNKSDRYERYVVNFKPEILERYHFSEQILAPFTDRALGSLNYYPADSFGNISPVDLFRRMLGASEWLTPEEAFMSYFPSLLCGIHTAFQERRHCSEAEGSGISRSLIDYVNEHLLDDISLREISEEVHVSISHLNRIFRAATGTSVYHYILSKRLIMAQHMISKGESALAASQKCGFRDYSAFYRLYKKRFSTSPVSAKPK